MKKLTIILLMILPFFAHAQKLASYKNIVENGYNFWVYTPAGYDSTVADKPIILFLHGSSLCGNDLERVRRYGTLDALSMGRQIDAVVVAPQNPGGSWQPSKLMNVVEWVEDHFPVDEDRLYVLGMSLGGYGTTHFAAISRQSGRSHGALRRQRPRRQLSALPGPPLDYARHRRQSHSAFRIAKGCERHGRMWRHLPTDFFQIARTKPRRTRQGFLPRRNIPVAFPTSALGCQPPG